MEQGAQSTVAFTTVPLHNRERIMSNKRKPTTNSSQATVYRIRLEGHLGPGWTGWFEGMTITLEEGGDTLLAGPVLDQAVLHGLLKKVRDLGMPLISVTRVETGHADAEGQLGAGPLR